MLRWRMFFKHSRAARRLREVESVTFMRELDCWIGRT
jgi:hypothetical protein